MIFAKPAHDPINRLRTQFREASPYANMDTLYTYNFQKSAGPGHHAARVSLEIYQSTVFQSWVSQLMLQSCQSIVSSVSGSANWSHAKCLISWIPSVQLRFFKPQIIKTHTKKRPLQRTHNLADD